MNYHPIVFSWYRNFFLRPYHKDISDNTDDEKYKEFHERFEIPMKSVFGLESIDEFKSAIQYINSLGVPNPALAFSTIFDIGQRDKLRGWDGFVLAGQQFDQKYITYWVLYPDLKEIAMISVDPLNHQIPYEKDLTEQHVLLSKVKDNALDDYAYKAYLRQTSPLKLDSEEINAARVLHHYEMLDANDFQIAAFCRNDGYRTRVTALDIAVLPDEVRDVVNGFPAARLSENDNNYFKTMSVLTKEIPGMFSRHVMDWWWNHEEEYLGYVDNPLSKVLDALNETMSHLVNPDMDLFIKKSLEHPIVRHFYEEAAKIMKEET